MKKVVELFNGTFRCIERLGQGLPGPHDHGKKIPFSKVSISKSKVVKIFGTDGKAINLSDETVTEIDEHSGYVVAATENRKYRFEIH